MTDCVKLLIYNSGLSHRILHLPKPRHDLDGIRLARRFPTMNQSKLPNDKGNKYLAWGVLSLMKTFHAFSSPIVDFPVVHESLCAFAMSLILVSSHVSLI